MRKSVKEVSERAILRSARRLKGFREDGYDCAGFIWWMSGSCDAGEDQFAGRDLKFMPQFVTLGLKVAFVVRIGLDPDGQLFHDFQPVTFKTNDLFRVVGQEPDFPDAEVVEDLGTHSVVAQVGGETELLIGFNRVEAPLLEFVGVNLRPEANAPPFLPKVEENPVILRNPLKRSVELASAVAAPGTEDISRETFGVDPDEGGLFGIDLSPGQGEVMGAIGMDAVKVAGKGTVFCRELDGLLTLDEDFGPAAVFDDLGNGAGLQPVELLVVSEVTNSRHTAVLMHDLAEDPSLWETGHAREVHGGLGMARPAQHAIVCGLQREDMSRLNERGGIGFAICEEPDCQGAIGSGDAGRDALGGVY